MQEDPFLPVHALINEENARKPLLQEHAIINEGNARRPILPEHFIVNGEKCTKTRYTRTRYNTL